MSKNKRLIISILLIVICVCACAYLFACKQEVKKSLYIISFNTMGGSNVDTIYLKEGESIKLPENPPVKKGYVFTGWYVDNECLYKLNVATFKAKRNLTIFAGWESVETYRHPITVLTTSEYGTLEVVSPADMRAKKGEFVTVEVKCVSGYMVKEGTLKANGVPLTHSEERFLWYEFVMPAEPVTVTCEFEPEPYEVLVYEGIANGTVIPSTESAHMGELVSLLVVPDYGYALQSLYFVGGDSISTGISNVGMFYMGSEAVKIGATFAEIDKTSYYSIKTEQKNGGSLSVDKNKYNAGECVDLTIVPNKGYALSRIVVMHNGERTILQNPTLVMPSSDITVRAEFSIIGENDTDYELTVLEPTNGKIDINNRKNNYKSGELVEFEVTANDGYVLDGVYANGAYVLGQSFRMPPSDCNVSAVFVKCGHSIEVVSSGDDSAFTYSLSADTAFAGEKINIEVIPDKGYVFEWDSLTYNSGIKIENGTFTMPDEDVIINVVVSKTGEPYSVNVVSGIGGSIAVNNTSASEYERVEFAVNADDGYALSRSGVVVTCKTPNGTVKKVPIINNYFVMPDSDVEIVATFERVYDVIAYDDGKFSVKPSVTKLSVGGGVKFTVTPYGNYLTEDIRLRVSIGSYSEELDESGYFELTKNMTAYGDEIYVKICNGVYPEINPIYNYSITVRKTEGGSVGVVGKTTGIIAGTLVRLNVVAHEGYELKSLTIVTDGYQEKIADTFTMPSSPVEIIAEFNKSKGDGDVFALKSSYERNSKYFENYGIRISYLSEKIQIRKLFGQNIDGYLGYIGGVIQAKALYGHDFYLFEVNDVAEVNRVAYAVARVIEAKNMRSPSVYIKNNHFVVSPFGNAKEDWYLYRNGITSYNDFLLYKRHNDTYGIYAYAGAKDYIVVPESYKNRSVSYIAPYAFAKTNGVQGISLSYIEVLDKFALYGLTEITSLDLRYVGKIGYGAFMDCRSLKRFSVPDYNTIYKDVDGVLFNATQSTLIAYPASRDGANYSLPSKTTEIADYAFYGAKSVNRIGYGGKLTTIGNYAFANAESISSICYDANTALQGVADFTINRSAVTHVGDYAFNGATRLSVFNLDTITYIGKYAFSYDQDSRLSLNLSECPRIPTAHFDIIENLYDGALRIAVRSSQAEYYSAHPVWGQYTLSIM